MVQLWVVGVDGPKTAVARNATADAVIEAIQPYNATVIQTGLSRGSERKLLEQLHQASPRGRRLGQLGLRHAGRHRARVGDDGRPVCGTAG